MTPTGTDAYGHLRPAMAIEACARAGGVGGAGAGSASAIPAPRIVQASLDNGLTLLLEPHPQARTVSYSLQLPRGSACDPQGRQGLSALTQEWCFKGAGDWDAQTLARRMDQIGLQEDHRVERELVVFSGTLLPQHLDAAWSILRAVISRPRFPAAGLEEVRELARQQLIALNDAPMSQMFYELGRRFFPPPLSNPAEGTLEGLETIRAQDAQDFHRTYGPQGAILSVAGRFDPARVSDLAEAHFGDWSGPPASLPPLADAVRRGLEHLERETEQTQIGVAYDSVPYAHPDYLKARVGVNALSGGMSARLFVEVRQKRGLVYAVFATHVTTKAFAGVLGYAGTTPERAQETLEVLLAELRRLREGIRPEELEVAQTRLKTGTILQGESTRARAEALAKEWFYRGSVRSLDELLAEVDALDLEEVNAYLAQAAPQPEEFTILTMGKSPVEVPDGS